MANGIVGSVLRVERVVTAWAMAAACAMLVIAVAAGAWQILARFVFLQPAEWSEVVVRFALIWMVFLGCPMAFRQGAMVSVDVLYRVAGRHGRRAFDSVVAIAALALIAVMIGWGFDYAMRGRLQTIPGLEEYSMTWAYLALPVGAVVSALAVVGNWLDPRRHELETAQ